MSELLPYLAGALVLLVWVRVERIASQLVDVQQKLEQIRRELGLAPALDTQPSAEVRRLAMDPGQTIEAIKRYREESGTDLATAKQTIEQLRR